MWKATPQEGRRVDGPQSANGLVFSDWSRYSRLALSRNNKQFENHWVDKVKKLWSYRRWLTKNSLHFPKPQIFVEICCTNLQNQYGAAMLEYLRGTWRPKKMSTSRTYFGYLGDWLSALNKQAFTLMVWTPAKKHFTCFLLSCYLFYSTICLSLHDLHCRLVLRISGNMLHKSKSQCKILLYLKKKAGLASRNIMIHLQKNNLRCVGFLVDSLKSSLHFGKKYLQSLAFKVKTRSS